MSVIYDATIKTARMTATRDAVANGTLELLTAADAVIATFGLDAAGGTVTGNDWTLVFVAATVAAGATGVLAKARIKNSGGTARVTGLTVGLSGSGADIIVDNTSANSGQNIQITSAKITHAA